MSKIPYVLADVVYYAATTPDDGTLYDTLVKMFDTLDHVGVKVYREDETVKLPTYSKQGDACMDVYVHSIEEKDDRVVYHTGLHFKLPEDYEMEIRPRSSNTKTMAIMQNAPGTLDSNEKGRIAGVFKQGELLENHSDNDNQQPSNDRNIVEGSTTNSRGLTDNADAGNADTSALPTK
jgi:dUTPase